MTRPSEMAKVVMKGVGLRSVRLLVNNGKRCDTTRVGLTDELGREYFEWRIEENKM